MAFCQLLCFNTFMDEIEPKEQNLSSKSSPNPKKLDMTLQEAVEFGEYDPGFLANFAEWHALSPHIQWQLVRKALDIRRRQMVTQYAELCNVLDLREKPHIQASIKNVERQLSELAKDRERLYTKFSSEM